MLQIKLESGSIVEISVEAMNILASNPYKFPKPKDVASTIQVDGKSIPNVKFVDSLEYIYNQCMTLLLQQVLVNSQVLHKRMSEIPLAEMEIGTSIVSRVVYISFWSFHCSVICINKSLTYAEVEGVLQFGLDKIDPSQYFVFEITKAIVKPRDFSKEALPSGMSKKAIERDLTT